MNKTISNKTSDPAQKLQQVLEAWRRFIVPFTSKMNTSGEVPDSLAWLVAMVLHNTTGGSSGKDIGLSDPATVVHIKQLKSLWPTIWIWMQKLYWRFPPVRLELRKRSRQVHTADNPKLDKDRNCYPIVVRSLLFFLGLYSERNALTNEFIALVEGTEGVLIMLAGSWIEEGKDDRAVLGLPSSAMHHSSFSQMLPNVERFIIAGCSGRSTEVAGLSLTRIPLNIRRLHWQNGLEMSEVFQTLRQDCNYVANTIRQPKASFHRAVREYPGFVSHFIAAIIYLLDAPQLKPPPQMFGTLAAMIELYMTVLSPRATRQTLECPFFDVVARVGLIHYTPQEKAGLQDFNTACSKIVGKMGHLSIYRPVLLKIRRNLPGIGRLIEKTTGEMPNKLSNLLFQGEMLLRRHEQYKQGVSPAFCCGNKKVLQISRMISHLAHITISVLGQMLMRSFIAAQAVR